MTKIRITNDNRGAAGDIDRFWQFRNSADKSDEAELILYGSISQRSWYNDDVTPQKFSEELAALGDISALTIRINSGGGDVFAAFAIYSRMIDLRNKGVKVTAVVDGWAASAATVICMAAERISIPAAAMFMIHNPKVGTLGYFEEKDLEQMIVELKTVKTAILAAYTAKTGKTSEEISALMDSEHWMDGAKAVNEGFCDDLITTVSPKVENSGGHAIVNTVDIGSIPDSIAALLKPVPENKAISLAVSTDEGEIHNKENAIMTLDELKAQHPELVAQIRADERKRIQAIEDAAVPGFESLVQDAKFTNPVEAGELALRICAEQKKTGARYLDDARSDAENSGVNDVHRTEPESVGNSAEDDDKQFEDDLNAVFGEKK